MFKLRYAWMLLLCGIGASALAAPEGWQSAWLPDSGLLLPLPPGWRLEADRPGPDARLVAPAAGEQVLVHPWTSARDLTAAEAAVEFQATLPAPRDAAAPTPLSGPPGVLVLGNWPAPGQAPLTAHAVYVWGAHCLAVSLRCAPERTAAARHEYFDALVAAVQLPGYVASEPAPGPAPPGPRPVVGPPVTQPVAPVTSSEMQPVAPPGPAPASSPLVIPPAPPPTPAPAPLTPRVVIPPVVAPVTPSETPPVTLPLAPPATTPLVVTPVTPSETPPIKRVSLGGFAVPDVEGWRASLLQGTLWVVDPGGASGYFLWPVRAPAGLDPQDLLSAWARQNERDLNLIARREAGGGTLITATLGADGKQRALFYLRGEGPSALLMGLYAPVAEWGRMGPRLAGWLGQVQSTGWRRTLPPLALASEPWLDRSQSLLLRIPAGWKAAGGVEDLPGKNGPTISLTAQGDGCQFNLQEPAIPALRELTPILESLGEQEGNTFRETENEDYLRILNRRTPAEYVTYLLSQPTAGLEGGQVQSAAPNEALAAMLPGADHQGAVVRVTGTHEGQPRERVYLAATASLPLRAGAFRWQGAFCYLDYPAGEFARAFGLLRVLLEGAHPAQARGDLAGVLSGYLEPLARALPSIPPPEAPPAGPVSLLGEGYEAAAGGAPQFSADAALESWRGLVQAPGLLPELSGNG